MKDLLLILKKSDLGGLIAQLSRASKVVAPVKHGVKNFAFAEVTRADEVSLDYIPTILPPKKYFMPQREIIQKFDREAHRWTPVVEAGVPTVILGVHTCDLAGIQFLNSVMAADPKDANYLARKANLTAIGLECNDYCDEYASCAVMKNHLPGGGYDIFLTDLGAEFLAEVATPAGQKIVEGSGVFAPAEEKHKKQFEELRARKTKAFKGEVTVKREELKKVFESTLQSKVWQDIDGRCVACGNCTNVCPTCYCFDIKDELDLNLTTGCRTRVWDSCQNEEFAKVAGGENFRHKRGQRQRHRYLRKFSYPVEKFASYACTGCGRCSRTCMAQISLKETINALAEEMKK